MSGSAVLSPAVPTVADVTAQLLAAEGASHVEGHYIADRFLAERERQRIAELLRAEHAPAIPARPSFDPDPHGEAVTGDGGTLVAHVVIDEFPRRWVRPPRDGEEWFWELDANEVRQHTTMEAFVRDVVDVYAQDDVTVSRHGSLWWVRSLHVHPRCRGHQLGARLLLHGLWSLVRAPQDLVVLEAHPEPTIFAPADAGGDDSTPPCRAAIAGLVRYFGRLGFMRAEQIARKFRRLARVGADGEGSTSRELGIDEWGPKSDDAAVPMYAFAGDLTTKGAPRLGRRVRS